MKYFVPFFLLFLGSDILYSQEVDRKYIEVYTYLKNTKQGKNETLNVCPVIRYIGMDCFLNKVDSSGNKVITWDLKDKASYFEPFVNKSIDSIFSNTRKYDSYLLFSRPIENILLVEVRNGEYNVNNSFMPYFGTAMRYLFLFDNKNRISQVFDCRIAYN